MSDYYRHIRSEIEKLLPRSATRILDLGAGAGTTSRWLKTFYPDAETVGIEINPDMIADLRQNVDVAVLGTVDEQIDGLGNFDLVLALDVLEHLPDPDATLAKLKDKLLPGGAIIISVPNIAHYSVSVPLVTGRRFRYKEAGIMDRTHLRFFVEETAVELITKAGLDFEAGLLSGMQGSKTRTLNRATFGLFRHYLTKQYLMRGRRSARPSGVTAAGSRPKWETL